VCKVIPPGSPSWITSKSPLNHIPRILEQLRKGRGHAFAGLFSSKDSPPSGIMIHIAWSFLSHGDRASSCSTFPTIRQYAILREYAITWPPHVWEKLNSLGPRQERKSEISNHCAYDLLALLLKFDFNVGDLIRWLDGPYNHEHTPLEPIREALATI